MSETDTLRRPQAGVRGVPALARELGVAAHVLRRELLLMSQLERAAFQRSGRHWLVADAQVQLVKRWLRVRGLLPESGGEDAAE